MTIKKKTLSLAVALSLSVVVLGFADDPNVGSWKLNDAKSKVPAGVSKNVTVVYTAAGDSYKCVVDGVDAAGKPSHNEWTGKFDGKDYALTGDPAADTRSYKRIDSHTLELTNKHGGKVTFTGRVVVAADGKTRTVTISGADSKGVKQTSTAVYDKQ
jgi:hypothetical protein